MIILQPRGDCMNNYFDYLIEDDEIPTQNQVEENIEEQPMQNSPDIELSAEEYLSMIQNGEMSIEEFDSMHENGQISDEMFEEVNNMLNSAETEEVPTAEDDIQHYVDGLLSGEITEDDLYNAVKNGELTEDQYNSIIGAANNSEQPIPEDGQEMMMDPGIPEEPEEQLEASPIEGQYKVLKIYDKFIELKKYINVYIQAYNKIENDELTSNQLKRLSLLYDEILVLRDNINFFLHSSNVSDYNKMLYTYLLYNKDFADQIRRFRRILNLSSVDLTNTDDKHKK